MEFFDTINELDEQIARLNYYLASSRAYTAELLGEIYCKSKDINPIVNGIEVSNRLIIEELERISKKITTLSRGEKYKEQTS